MHKGVVDAVSSDVAFLVSGLVLVVMFFLGSWVLDQLALSAFREAWNSCDGHCPKCGAFVLGPVVEHDSLHGLLGGGPYDWRSDAEYARDWDDWPVTRAVLASEAEDSGDSA